MTHISRREFVALAAGVAGGPLVRTAPAAAAITAQDVVDRIRKNVGVEWKAETLDTFKAGGPFTVATGIVTTALPTLDVLGRAVKAGANIIITCEPTFFGRADSPTPPARGGGPGRAGGGASGRGAAQRSPSPARDPVFSGKDEFIRKNGLVVFRFSDHWRVRRPDPMAAGLIDALGWSKLRTADDQARVEIPEVPLVQFVAHVKKTLNARGGVRVVGARDTPVRRVGVLAGATPIQASLSLLPSVDVILAGEVREWESVEYVRDTVAAGEKKALVLVGRVLSEDPGMRVCADWLRSIVPEVTTSWIPAGDPYWRPL